MTKLKGSGSKVSENESKIVCPYCGKALPKDSEFCQFCGNNLASKQDGVAEDLVAEIIVNELSESAELIIKKVCLYSIGDERSYIHCYFKSVSERIINAVLFDVMCFDIFGNELPIVHNAQILDLSVSRNDTFENTKHIYIDNANVRMVKIKIRKVLLSDGSIIDCDEKTISLHTPVSLEEKLDSKELAQQFVRDTTSFSKYFPERMGYFWQCSCGSINTDVEIYCNHCKQNQKELFELTNTDLLQERLSAYESEKAARVKIEAEEKRRMDLAQQEEQARIRAENEIRVRNERNLAVLKRMEATQIAEKRRKKIKIIVGVVIAILITVFIVIEVKKSNYNGQLRNFATESMSEDYTNVYADVVSIEPVYFVCQYKESRSGVKIGSGDLWDVVCKCKTVEGKTIWISVFYQYYPGGNYSKNEEDYKTITYSTSNPKRITGDVDTARQVVSELESKIGNIYVLDVRSKITD